MRLLWSISLVVLFFISLELTLNEIVPNEPSWKLRGYQSVEAYYAQSPAHFETENETGLCKTHSELTKGKDSTQMAMQPQRFPCKPISQRIVTLGGSSIQGYGLPFSHTLASQLQEQLSQMGSTVDVINAGVAGYNSLQIRRMLSEVWDLEPDILILYTGHNDYVYYPVIEQLLNDNPSFHLIRKGGRRLAIWRGLKALLLHTEWIKPPPSLTPPLERPSFDRQAKAAFNQLSLPKAQTVQALKQLQTQQRQAEETIFRFIQKNISDIANQATLNQCKLLLIGPVSRLDSPPVDGIIWNTLSQNELDAFWPLWEDILQNTPSFNDSKWAEALRIAPRYAPLAHLYAQAAYQAGENETAIQYWTRAQEDSPPTRRIRAGNAMADWIIHIGKELDLPTIDPRKPFQQAAKVNGIPAGTLFLDSLHFSVKGNALLTALSLDRIKKEAWISKPNSLH